MNEKNEYNQNFTGLYCTCHRPYPDLEIPEGEEDEMIQCIRCEDWYHSKVCAVEWYPLISFFVRRLIS